MERRPMPPSKRERPHLAQPTLVDLVGGLVLLAISAALVGVAIVAAAG